MSQEEILEAIQKTLEAQRLAAEKPKVSPWESWLERHRNIMGLVGITGALLTISLTLRSLSNEGQKRVSEAIDKAFDQQLGQTNSDAAVVKLMAEQMQSLKGQAVTKATPAERKSTEGAAALWESELPALVKGYQAQYGTFEINQSAVASLRSVFDVLLSRAESQPGEKAESVARKDKEKASRGEGIIAPQLTAGASSFDPTVRTASLQLSSYLTSRHAEWTPLDAAKLSVLKRSFRMQFLGMTSYKGAGYTKAGAQEVAHQEAILGDEALLLNDYSLKDARFDKAIFNAPVSFANADLEGCFFNKAEFNYGGVFDGAKLKNVSFPGAHIGSLNGKVSFKGSQLDGAKFSPESVPPAPSPGAPAPRVTPDPVTESAEFRNVEFDEAKFAKESPPNFSSVKFLQGVKFTNTPLPSVHFDDAVLADVEFIGTTKDAPTNMTGMFFVGVMRNEIGSTGIGPKLSFTNVDLSGSTFTAPKPADLRKATFSGCRLDQINFSAADLTDVTFTDSHSEKVAFSTQIPSDTVPALTGKPLKIIGGKFTKGSWLVNIDPAKFESKVGIDFSFVTESFISAMGEGRCAFALDDKPDSTSVAICIEIEANGYVFKSIMRRKGGTIFFSDANKTADGAAVLEVLNDHAEKFGFDPVSSDKPSDKSLDKTAWITRFGTPGKNRPAIVWK